MLLAHKLNDKKAKAQCVSLAKLNKWPEKNSGAKMKKFFSH
jgi:hypothetical protein